VVVVLVLPNPFQEMVAEKFRGNPTVGPRPKVCIRDQRWSSARDGAPEWLRCGTIQNELHVAVNDRSCSWWQQVRRRCKKNSPSVYIMAKEGCDCGNKVGTVHSRRVEEGQFLCGLFQFLLRLLRASSSDLI